MRYRTHIALLHAITLRHDGIACGNGYAHDVVAASSLIGRARHSPTSSSSNISRRPTNQVCDARRHHHLPTSGEKRRQVLSNCNNIAFVSPLLSTHDTCSSTPQPRRTHASKSHPLLHAKPKSGSVVDSYQTVSVNCSKCRTRLFRYKKKNGTKSNLVKCYIERISEDSAGVLEDMVVGREESGAEDGQQWCCPNCGQKFGRGATIHGRPAVKLVGGKIRMTKK